jgi:disulfide bond formation protein DsbB
MDKNRRWYFFLTLMCYGAVAFSYIAQYILHKTPCQLCLYERYIIIAAAIIGSMSWIFFRYRRMGQVCIFFMILSLAVGGGVSGFHVGVERHWWRGTSSCYQAGGLTKADLMIPWKEQIKKMKNNIKDFAPCDEVKWRIFGISATIWTFLMFCVLFLMAFMGRRWRHHSRRK